MQAFKVFFEKLILGLIETIIIEKIGPVAAKVDSGNGAYNVIHGVDIRVHNKIVTFRTIKGKILVLPLKETIDINIGSGNIEKRPVVELNIAVHKKIYRNIKFSIADRSQNEEQVLLGKDFIIRLGGLIDVRK